MHICFDTYMAHAIKMMCYMNRHSLWTAFFSVAVNLMVGCLDIFAHIQVRYSWGLKHVLVWDTKLGVPTANMSHTFQSTGFPFETFGSDQASDSASAYPCWSFSPPEASFQDGGTWHFVLDRSHFSWWCWVIGSLPKDWCEKETSHVRKGSRKEEFV